MRFNPRLLLKPSGTERSWDSTEFAEAIGCKSCGKYVNWVTRLYVKSALMRPEQKKPAVDREMVPKLLLKSWIQTYPPRLLKDLTHLIGLS